MDAKYAYRLETRKVREPDFQYNGIVFSEAEKTYLFAKSLQDLDYEKFLILHVNDALRLCCIQYFNGTTNQAAVYPKEIIKHCILTGARGVILIHNHPAGVFDFSDEDIQITHKLQEAFKIMDLTIFDHILIYGDGKYRSMRGSGLL